MPDLRILPALDTSSLKDARLVRQAERALVELASTDDREIPRRSGALDADGWLLAESSRDSAPSHRDTATPPAAPGTPHPSTPGTADPAAPPTPTLVLTSLAALDRAVVPSSALRWMGAVRRHRPWIAAFVLTDEDRAVAHRAESILRSLDGRLTLLPAPRRGRGRSRLAHWLTDLTSLLHPEAILEAHLERAEGMEGEADPGMEGTAEPLLVVRYGDDRTGRAPLSRVGLGPDHGVPHVQVVSPGAGGRSLQVSVGERQMVLGFEAATIRTCMEEQPGGLSGGMGGADATGRADEMPDARQLGDSAAPATPGESSPGTRPFTLGGRIRAAREARDMSQADLADKVGIHQSMISNLERDVHSPRLETVLRLARGLRISPAALVDGIRMPADSPQTPPETEAPVPD